MNNVMTKLATLDENKRISGYAPLEDNPITDTDSYKPSHGCAVLPGMRACTSYFESRGGRYRNTSSTAFRR